MNGKSDDSHLLIPDRAGDRNWMRDKGCVSLFFRRKTLFEMPIFTATLWIVVSAIFAGGCSSDPVSNVEQQVSNAEREMVHQTLASVVRLESFDPPSSQYWGAGTRNGCIFVRFHQVEHGVVILEVRADSAVEIWAATVARSISRSEFHASLDEGALLTCFQEANVRE